MKNPKVVSSNDLDTFDSYYGTPFINDDHIIIPYINMGLMPGHPLNPTNDLRYIDFSYLQIIRPQYIAIYKQGIPIDHIGVHKKEHLKWFGGIHIGQHSVLDGDLEVEAEIINLLLPHYCELSSELWIPKVKHYKKIGNVEEEKVKVFFKQVSEIRKP